MARLKDLERDVVGEARTCTSCGKTHYTLKLKGDWFPAALNRKYMKVSVYQCMHCGRIRCNHNFGLSWSCMTSGCPCGGTDFDSVDALIKVVEDDSPFSLLKNLFK